LNNLIRYIDGEFDELKIIFDFKNITLVLTDYCALFATSNSIVKKI